MTIQTLHEHVRSWKRQMPAPAALRLPTETFDDIQAQLLQMGACSFPYQSDDCYMFGMRVIRADVVLPEPVYGEGS